MLFRSDYLGQFLKVGRKKPTTTGLWLRVLQGDSRAIRDMVSYNKQDVLLLERVFLKLRPYIPNLLSRELTGGKMDECPRCGSTSIQSRGVHRASTQTYGRYRCNDCEGWFRDRKAIKRTIKSRLL